MGFIYGSRDCVASVIYHLFYYVVDTEKKTLPDFLTRIRINIFCRLCSAAVCED